MKKTMGQTGKPVRRRLSYVPKIDGRTPDHRHRPRLNLELQVLEKSTSPLPRAELAFMARWQRSGRERGCLACDSGKRKYIWPCWRYSSSGTEGTKVPTDKDSELHRKQLGFCEITCLAWIGCFNSCTLPSTWITMMLREPLDGGRRLILPRWSAAWWVGGGDDDDLLLVVLMVFWEEAQTPMLGLSLSGLFAEENKNKVWAFGGGWKYMVESV